MTNVWIGSSKDLGKCSIYAAESTANYRGMMLYTWNLRSCKVVFFFVYKQKGRYAPVTLTLLGSLNVQASYPTSRSFSVNQGNRYSAAFTLWETIDHMFSSRLQLRSSAAKRCRRAAAVLEVAERFWVYFAEWDGNESKTWVPAACLASLTSSAGLHGNTCWKNSPPSPCRSLPGDEGSCGCHVTAFRTTKPCALFVLLCCSSDEPRLLQTLTVSIPPCFPKSLVSPAPASVVRPSLTQHRNPQTKCMWVPWAVTNRRQHSCHNGLLEQTG